MMNGGWNRVRRVLMTFWCHADWDDWGIKLLSNPNGGFSGGLSSVPVWVGLARVEFCDGCAQRGFREEFPIDRTIRATRHVSGDSSETTRERESCSCSRELELQQLSGRWPYTQRRDRYSRWSPIWTSRETHIGLNLHAFINEWTTPTEQRV